MNVIEPCKPPFYQFHHVGVIVRDLDKAIAHYHALGIGPFEKGPWRQFRNLVRTSKKVNGKPVESSAIANKIACAECAPVNYELIQPGGDPSLSLWLKFLETKGEGINHLAYMVNDLPRGTAELEERGFKAVFETSLSNGAGAAYFGTGDVGGIIFELISFK